MSYTRSYDTDLNTLRVCATSTIYPRVLVRFRFTIASYFSYLLPCPVCLSSCSFVCAAVICYSPASSTCSFFLRQLCTASSRNWFVFLQYFLVVRISWVACLSCSRTRYVSTCFLYLDYFATLALLCLTVGDHIFCISFSTGRPG